MQPPIIDARRALRAAINVGRLCKHVRVKGLLPHVDVGFNVLRVRPRNSVLITYTHVEKTYHNLTKEEQTGLINFYLATAKVGHLEHADCMEREGDELRVRLRPVGLARMPKSLLEAKVRGRLECMPLPVLPLPVGQHGGWSSTCGWTAGGLPARLPCKGPCCMMC